MLAPPDPQTVTLGMPTVLIAGVAAVVAALIAAAAALSGVAVNAWQARRNLSLQHGHDVAERNAEQRVTSYAEFLAEADKLLVTATAPAGERTAVDVSKGISKMMVTLQRAKLVATAGTFKCLNDYGRTLVEFAEDAKNNLAKDTNHELGDRNRAARRELFRSMRSDLGMETVTVAGGYSGEEDE